MNNENKELSKLININEDACEFYELASIKAENPQIKRTFADLEQLHENVVVQLKDLVRENGENPEANETFVGKTRKFWGEAMANMSLNVDETLVKHLEQTEDRCLNSMQNSIDKDEITPSEKAVLKEQCVKLKKSHDFMKAIKDSMKRAA